MTVVRGVLIGVLSLVSASLLPHGAAMSQVPPLPPDLPVVEAIPTIIPLLRQDRPQQLNAIAALGHLGHGQQPLPFVVEPNTAEPAVLKLWEENAERDRQRRAHIMSLLAAATPDLVNLASHADAGLRRDALWALGAIRADTPEARARLAAVAGEAAAASLERQMALIALGRVSPADARPIITSILDDAASDPGLVSASVAVLRTMGADAVPHLGALLRSTDPLRRGYAVNALGALKTVAAPAAAQIVELLTPEQPPRLQAALVWTLTAVNPDDVATLERIIATPAFDRQVCGSAGDALARRPGGVAHDNARCAKHAATPPPQTGLPETVQAAMLAAAGGGEDLTISRSGETTWYGDAYGHHTERVIVACIEPRDHARTFDAGMRAQTASAPAPNELRIAAVRVAGDNIVLDAVGGRLDTGAPSASCKDIRVEPVRDPARWPATHLELRTGTPSKAATTYIEWTGLVDPGTQLWKWRLPAMLYHLRDDGTIFADQLANEVSATRTARVVGRFSGIEVIASPEAPTLGMRYAFPLTVATGTVPPMIVPAAPLAQASWTRVVMYPMDFSGVARAKPVVPDGLPVTTLAGGLILPHPPDDPAQKPGYWRKYLRHEHLAVRIMAANQLTALKDRESLPAIVAILTTPSDLALESARGLQTFGADALPHLEPLLRDERLRVREAAWAAVGTLGDPALPLVLTALDRGTSGDRALALKALARMPRAATAGAVGSIVPLLDQCDSAGRVLSCFDVLDALSRAGTAAATARPALEQRMASTTGYARLRTAAALSAVGGRERALPVIIEIARTGRDSDAENALRQLAPDLAGEALPVFLELLQRRDAVRSGGFAAFQIGMMTAPPDAAYPVVAMLARDADPAMRRRAAAAVKAFKTPAATALVGALLKDPDIQIRRDALAQLRERGLDGVSWLQPVLEEPGHPQRTEVIGHLMRLGPPVATAAPGMLRALDRLAKDDPNPGTRNYAAQAAAAIRGTK